MVPSDSFHTAGQSQLTGWVGHLTGVTWKMVAQACLYVLGELSCDIPHLMLFQRVTVEQRVTRAFQVLLGACFSVSALHRNRIHACRCQVSAAGVMHAQVCSPIYIPEHAPPHKAHKTTARLVGFRQAAVATAVTMNAGRSSHYPGLTGSTHIIYIYMHA